MACAELMRLLLDEYALDWNLAWTITQKSFAYTNHTLLPEALEKWPISLFGKLLPRHLEIIFEINARFLELVRMKFPKDKGRLARLSLIDESGERYVRMAKPGLCVQPHHQRRCRPPQRTAEGNRAARLFTNSFRKSSVIKPTALPPAAGWCSAIPV